MLEHIYDDTKALAELHRILAPSGIIFIMTPLLFQYLNHTYKRIDGTEMPHLMELDPDITFELKSSKKQLDPAIQLRLYGQSDHVRIYGKKALKEKCENSGFYVDIASYEAFESTYIKRAGLIDDVFILTKK